MEYFQYTVYVFLYDKVLHLIFFQLQTTFVGEILKLENIFRSEVANVAICAFLKHSLFFMKFP